MFKNKSAVEKFLFYTTNVFTKRRITSHITESMYLWNNKPIKDKSVLLWDLENIPFSRLDDVKQIVKYTPQDLYVITRQKLSNNTRIKIEREHFRIFDEHKTISDDKILSIMKLYGSRPNMILISSDSDFAKEVNKYVKNNKLQWIVAERNKNAVIMRANIGNMNLTISPLPIRASLQSKSSTQQIKNQKGTFYSPANINNQYGIFQYFYYYRGVFSRKYQTLMDSLKKILTRIKKTAKSEEVQNAEQSIVPECSNAYVYRFDFNSKKKVCGRIELNRFGQPVLILHRHLQSKYDMPKISRSIKFSNYESINKFIYYNSQANEYYLKKFDRLSW